MTGSRVVELHDRELRLVAALAQHPMDDAGVARVRALATRSVDWDRLRRIARRNGLAPLLFWNANQVCRDLVPPATLARLRDHFARNSALNAVRTAQLLDLLSLLKRRGVDAVPYKGPAAAVSQYGNVGLREFSDLDLLVRERDVWVAADAMESSGFSPDYEVAPAWRAAFLRDDYVQMFRRDAGRTLVELHWRVAPRSFGVPIDADDLWPRLQHAEVQGVSVLMPSVEDQLLLLTVHAARHGWDKLEAVAGVAALLRQHDDINWPMVWNLASRMRCRRMVMFGLLLAHCLLDVPLPASMPDTARFRSFDRIARLVVLQMAASDAASPEGWPLLALHLQLRDRSIDGARQLFRQISITKPIDRASFPLARPMSFAYPLVRAFRIVRKYGFNH
jgi:hypothetical protein